MSSDKRKGFTLIEVLIVVVIMAVLAATIIPQFSSSTEEAKESSLSHNLHTMRGLIEMYKQEHGLYPSLANFATQMTSATNSNGGTTGETPYGPYIGEAVPTNYLNDSNAVVGVATAGTKPTAVVAGGAGWQYDESNGGIWANNSEFYE